MLGARPKKMMNMYILDILKHYTDAERQQFEAYLEGQLAKIDIPNKDVPFLRERMLTMYANPARNHMAVVGKA